MTEVQTRVGADRDIRLSDLPLKSHERLFFERVPLPHEARSRIRVSEPERQYGDLAEGVEAWGFRLMRDRGELMNRKEVALGVARGGVRAGGGDAPEADLIGDQTETEAYMRVAAERYRLLRTHEWNEDVIERLKR